jgi:hypothetical protein
VRSSSEIVLQIIEHTVIYPDSDPSLKIIIICLTILY